MPKTNETRIFPMPLHFSYLIQNAPEIMKYGKPLQNFLPLNTKIRLWFPCHKEIMCRIFAVNKKVTFSRQSENRGLMERFENVSWV